MTLRKTTLMMLTLFFSLGLVGEAMADISNAAVLFLRIAPGSRAAGMGEAYVAIADDATATHWNPAGLGKYPLANTWVESRIPQAYRPLMGFAPLSTGGTTNYLDYDIWAITPAGLIRYDNKRWHVSEVFSTRTDETAEQKIKDYFDVTDDARLAQMVETVAEINNRGTRDELTGLRDSILNAIPADYDQLETLTLDLDSLLECYSLCRVNWDRVKELRERLVDGLKDSILTDTECDRISVTAERSRNRFLREEFSIPYRALFDVEPTAIASNGEILLVGSTSGLARYNGRNWRMVSTDEGAELGSISALHVVEKSILVATEQGIQLFDGLTARRLTTGAGSLPDGTIDAIGGNSLTELYAVVEGQLYRFNGRHWSRDRAHTVAIDDSMAKIAAQYSIYDTEADKALFVERYTELQNRLIQAEVAAAALAETDAATEVVALDSTGVEAVTDSVETTIADTTAVVDTEPESPALAGVPGIDEPLTPGDVIRVPLVASVKGKVRAIYVDSRRNLWLGTDQGIFMFDGLTWVAPGYEDHLVVEDETLSTLVAKRSDMSDAEANAYRDQLAEINDLGADQPEVGTTIKIYKHSAAKPVNSIVGEGSHILFATENGLIEYDGSKWTRSGLGGLTRANIVGARTLGNERWIASDERLVIKGRGQSEISLMHVKWLPELADDLYYEFFSVVSSKDGWGTFGGSITYISYGTFQRTNATSPEVVGEFESFDFALALSYGTSLTNKLKAGLSFKVIYSRLSILGTGAEKGNGTATGFGVDLGLLYDVSTRLTLGMALTNLGPKMSYIDAEQSDPLPRNLAIGMAYRLLQSDYTSLLITAEVNKLMVGLDDDSSDELRQSVINGGAEFTYANLLSIRAGYIYDQEGSIKTPTLGFGLAPFSWGDIDFAYIPSQDEFSLANTLRISARFIF
jgi:hypothetical protein